MDFENTDVYNLLTFNQWQEAIECILHYGTGQEPTLPDEVKTMAAFRDLCPPEAAGIHSRINLFLLGFRTRVKMGSILHTEQGFAADQGYFVASLPYKALEHTLTQMHKPQRSMMEIVVMHHLAYFLSHIASESLPYILYPQHLSIEEYFFLCGYQIIYKLYALAWV